MKVRDLIRQLLDQPMDSDVYIGKGMGVLTSVESDISDRIVVILSPAAKAGRTGEAAMTHKQPFLGDQDMKLITDALWNDIRLDQEILAGEVWFEQTSRAGFRALTQRVFTDGEAEQLRREMALKQELLNGLSRPVPGSST